MASEETSGARAQKSAGPGSEEGFDERLARLEEIVLELERGELGLEPAIERYKRGVVLLKECRDVLEGYRKQVEELAEDGAVAPFDDDPDRTGGRP